MKWFDYYQKPKNGYLVCLDTIVKYCNGQRRYIITAIDNFSKVAFARMYKNHSSYNTADFLNRLMYLLDGKIDNIQTDNGSEFQKYFEKACQELSLDRYYSRVRNHKDNAVCERFNRTLQEEFIQLGNYTNNPEVFNRYLTDWLIEYNFHRPHASLNYETPINFNNSERVLPRYSSCTIY